ncbi:5'-methylthioadenosine/S-adenosylhomocysteine nucleosidase [Aquabacterium sp. A7-Y]|uniref:5'-methylthioadenosine/S-adenosylhomocysteine nucleosidase n=1 Tax=Aquabacterium sp. A7-Y TaxID=1349605 RepID=UPI00223C8C12|nr:5'-methylthioadenosine/S-adenosylhomocysteine nucleosidase [Aquabacterium sp. A7-Y]MCW7539423.1 5'-methylthioadenosine/S-adenosylhomocysteine nucleosidase [Aquabacterium sp. A7-Y]
MTFQRLFPRALMARLVPALALLLAAAGCAAAGDPPAAAGPSHQAHAEQPGDKHRGRCLTDCAERIGIVSAFGAEADILVAQTLRPRTHVINGNRFTTGTLKGVPVVIVLSGVSIVNSTMVTQLMLDHFRIERLIMSGISGGVNPAHHIGDVLVPEKWAMPLEVYWNGNNSVPSACGTPGDLACLGLKLATRDGQPLPGYSIPTPRGAVATGLFIRETYVLNGRNAPQGEFRLDYPVDAAMLRVARSIKPQLERCGPRNPQLCVTVQPQLKAGGRGVSGPAFLANPDYRRYLYDTLQAETIEMETAALAHVAYANQVPYIAFRSLSDLAGGDDFTEVGAFFGSGLAEANASAVTLAFLEAWKRQANKP